MLSLVIKSHSDRLLKLFTRGTPFAPALALNQGGFAIADVANNINIPQTSVLVQRAPLSRARGSGDEEYSLTLHWHTPITVSTDFGPGGHLRPQPRAVVERGWELEERGNERKIRRSTRTCGVDGLEGGKKYKPNVVHNKLVGIWWRWGVKQNILVDHESLNLNLSCLQLEQSPFVIEEIEGVEFSVQE